MGLCGSHSCWEEAEIGHTFSIHSEKSYVGGSGGDSAGNGANMLPWSWKECSLLCMLEAFEFCLTLCAPSTMQMTTAVQPSEGSFEGI
jgi:hypothetical protein